LLDIRHAPRKSDSS